VPQFRHLILPFLRKTDLRTHHSEIDHPGLERLRTHAKRFAMSPTGGVIFPIALLFLTVTALSNSPSINGTTGPLLRLGRHPESYRKQRKSEQY